MDFLHDSFAVEIAEYDEWRERSRKSNFFELVYVLNGSGYQGVNHMQYPYTQNGIFLLPTAKCHYYKVKERTRFLFVRFTGNYFMPGPHDAVDYSSWFSRLNFIFGHHDYHPGELVEDPADKAQLKSLLDIILQEYKRQDICSAFIIQNTLVAVLAVICRNIQKKKLGSHRFTDSRFADLINFISFHITDLEKLSVSYLSQNFHIAETYFSEYFRRNANERFQDYVMKLRLKIAESRAIYTDAAMQDIALELGFTDSSHMNRMMKKYYGKGMREIRGANKMADR
ncbi:helix-turn-helix domain-containing protein [Chitinophaga qingshengii]|uniref:Helix-turn-helix transcriptional regulator n=1 Tax=Chitinophaga qingshengii TaxID=1569794 RepID=A0ABR7TI65_9BACT|nr:AraC family transcriptional regulator [Chitinophaga qingshengii]MBC9929201.1 helix-turn-helix transcriptional regulator [Chitinophaga qingshengii]